MVTLYLITCNISVSASHPHGISKMTDFSLEVDRTDHSVSTSASSGNRSKHPMTLNSHLGLWLSPGNLSNVVLISQGTALTTRVLHSLESQLAQLSIRAFGYEVDPVRKCVRSTWKTRGKRRRQGIWMLCQISLLCAISIGWGECCGQLPRAPGSS